MIPEENYNFTYKVKQIDIEQGTFEVVFTPESEYLTPIMLNTYLIPISYLDIRNENNELIYTSQDDVPFSEHITNTIKSVTPLFQWKKQFMMQQHIEELLASTATIAIDPSTIVMPVLNPNPPTEPQVDA